MYFTIGKEGEGDWVHPLGKTGQILEKENLIRIIGSLQPIIQGIRFQLVGNGVILGLILLRYGLSTGLFGRIGLGQEKWLGFPFPHWTPNWGKGYLGIKTGWLGRESPEPNCLGKKGCPTQFWGGSGKVNSGINLKAGVGIDWGRGALLINFPRNWKGGTPKLEKLIGVLGGRL